MTRNQILELFKSDEIIKNTLSKDSVTNTINTLREAGCIISRPSMKTNNCYVLKYHPFLCSLVQENIDALQSLRSSVATLGDWELVLRLNKLYEKISKYAVNEDLKNTLIYDHELKNINLDLLKLLLVSIRLKKYINICYFSPQNGEEELEILLQNISLNNNYLYLWGYCSKYEEYSYLRVDRIKKIKSINLRSEEDEGFSYEKPEIFVEYKLKNLSAMMYLENADEKVLSVAGGKDKEKVLTIKAKVSNKFSFFQKILSYGTDCKILSPVEIINEYKEILSKIKSGYNDASK